MNVESVKAIYLKDVRICVARFAGNDALRLCNALGAALKSSYDGKSTNRLKIIKRAWQLDMHFDEIIYQTCFPTIEPEAHIPLGEHLDKG